MSSAGLSDPDEGKLPSRPEGLGRDVGAPSTRNTSKGALVREAQVVFRALGHAASLSEIRQACLQGELLRKSARETRNRVWDALHWRYFAWDPPAWVLRDLTDAASGEGLPANFVSLLYLHFARRDRLTFDFVTDKLWSLWKGQRSEVHRNDVLDFLAAYEGEHLHIKKWRESSRKKLAGNVLSALRDFGVLRGVQRKTIERPSVPAEVALHLVRLLSREGLRGRRVPEAMDWRLFLWESHDIAQALSALAQRGALRFERSGSTVVLDVPGSGDAA